MGERGRVTAQGARGQGAYAGRSVSVLPLGVRASNAVEGIQRINESLDALEATVATFEWAEVLPSPRDAMDACRDAAALYEVVVLDEAAEAARRQ